jgi:hypothetical protein
MQEVDWMKRQAFEKWGLEEYSDCWTFEMPLRPIPFVSTDTRPLRVLEKFERYIQPLLNVLAPTMEPHIQTINKISKLGWPVHANPKDESGRMLKFDIVLEFFDRFDQGDFSGFEESFSTNSVRLQNEPPSKLRTFQFIDSRGRIIEKEVDRRDYKRKIEGLGDMIPSRTRTVTSPAVINLYLQCWDTMLHRAIMKHPLCEANIYTTQRWQHPELFTSFDCKHYERYIGMLVFKYAETIGGDYGYWLTKLAKDPTLVPSIDWKANFLIRPRFSRTTFPQLGSGICVVATLGKLANMCVRIAFLVEVKGLSVFNAILTMLTGEYDGVRHWMYGDDNRLHGNQDKKKDFLDYFGDHFVIETDDVPHYLGTVLRSEMERFLLPKDTYNLKLYCPERDWGFKTYPAIGAVERRKTFSEFGEPEISADIIPFEDDLFIKVGHPWFETVHGAMKERMEAKDSGAVVDPKVVTDKEYLMTPEEQVATGEFWHLPAARTRAIVTKIVGKEIKDKLAFS